MDKIVKSLSDAFATEQGMQGVDESTQFEAFVANALLSAHFEDDFNSLDFVLGAGGDLGVDVAGIIVNGDLLLDPTDIELAAQGSRQLDVKFVLIQAKRTQGFEAHVVSDLADNLEHLFTQEEVRYPANQDVISLKQSISVIYEDIGKISRSMPELIVIYAATGVVGDDLLAQKCTAAQRRLDATNYFSRVTVSAMGAKELRNAHQAATSAVSADFTMDKRLTLPRIPGVTQAFLGVLPALDVVRIISDSSGGIRKSVFFDNVRDFQDFNPVNQEIYDTLEDSVGKNRFAVLNNGITIVTRSMTLAGDDFRLKDFQIVNGCQTCHVLWHAQQMLTADVHVSVRIIQSEDEEVISGITAATNRQTAVTEDDLAAQEQYHKDLEALFETFEASHRLYYERRSRQYSELSVERTRVVSRAQLTRTFASMFLEEPSRAGRYVNQLKEARKDDLFNPTQNPLAYYTSAAAFYRIEWLLRNRLDRRYSPARYQLLMALKLAVIGDGALPAGNRKSKPKCEAILDVVWDTDRAEAVMNLILPIIDSVVEEETPGQTLDRDTVRTRSFSDRLKSQVLSARTEGRFESA